MVGATVVVRFSPRKTYSMRPYRKAVVAQQKKANLSHKLRTFDSGVVVDHEVSNRGLKNGQIEMVEGM
jgi:hypothetical protein